MITLFAVVLGASTALGTAPGAMDEAERWAVAKFEVAADAGAGPSLQVIANNVLVQQNGRMGKPMRIAGQEFTRGSC